MVPCIFQLSELGEFGLVLQEQNKDSFMRRFADCVKALLFAKVTQGYAVGGFPFAGNAVWESNPATVMSVWALSDFKTDLKADWALLKEMMVFTPDYGMQKLIAANLRFLQRCLARMAKLADRGLWYLFCHCRRYRAVRRYFHNADRTVTFQDLFSAAIAQFVLKGWGKASDFKCLLSAL